MLLSEFFQEVAVVSKLQHPNICRFFGAAIEPPRYCVVFEYMEGGDLFHHIRKNKHIDFFAMANVRIIRSVCVCVCVRASNQCILLSQDIAQGMHYMHLSNFIHRDLKSGNLLLSKTGVVKVTDFGLSRFLDTDGDMTAETGTYRWMAPEVIRHEPYTKAADIYSFAMVLFEMLSRKQPFEGLTPVQAAYAVAKDDLRPTFPTGTPESVIDLVQKCWSRDPLKRPTFEEIIRMLERVKVGLNKKEMKNVCEKYIY